MYLLYYTRSTYIIGVYSLGICILLSMPFDAYHLSRPDALFIYRHTVSTHLPLEFLPFGALPWWRYYLRPLFNTACIGARMSDVVNLNKVRKAKRKQAETAKARENRIVHGLSK